MIQAIWPLTIRPVFVAALVLSLNACTPDDVTSFYGKALPEALETTGHVTWGSDRNWFDIFLPLRPEACGAVIFYLTPETVDKIQHQGIAFFTDARRARGYHPGSSKAYYYSYAAWQATPAPSNWFGDGAVAGSLDCAGFGNRLISRITQSAKNPGGYFTTASEAQLIVLPSEAIAILTYFR